MSGRLLPLPGLRPEAGARCSCPAAVRGPGRQEGCSRGGRDLLSCEDSDERLPLGCLGLPALLEREQEADVEESRRL